MSYTITTIERSLQPVLVIRRHVNPAGIAGAIAEVLSRVIQFAQANKIAPVGPPVCRYVEMGPGSMTIEPGIPIAAPIDIPDDPEIKRDTLPGGLLVLTEHSGSYDRLSDAHAALQEWMAKEGLTPAGGPWESYVNDPGVHPDPKDWKTEVFWPVKLRAQITRA